MRSSRFGVVAFFAITLAGCAGGPFMQLRECRFKDCYDIRKGVTPQEFFQAKVKVPPPPNKRYQLDGDVWDIYVFGVTMSEPGVIPAPDDPLTGGGVGAGQTHDEFVAFKNGRLDNWGWGTMPRYLKQNRARLTLLTSGS